MNYLEKKQEEIVEGIFGFFATKLAANPAATLRQVDSELNSLYTRFGQDWTGRGIVGDTTQMATIAGLEAVRAECLAQLQSAGAGQANCSRQINCAGAARG